MEAGSVTPGRCDLAPEIVRKTLRRFSTYDVETGKELDLRILDAGDADVRGVMPAEGFAPIEMALSRCTVDHDLTILLGGNNAGTRPGAQDLGVPRDRDRHTQLATHFERLEER